MDRVLLVRAYECIVKGEVENFLLYQMEVVYLIIKRWDFKTISWACILIFPNPQFLLRKTGGVLPWDFPEADF